MIKGYLLVDNKGLAKLHWCRGLATDWEDFLTVCREGVARGDYNGRLLVIANGHRVGRLGNLLKL